MPTSRKPFRTLKRPVGAPDHFTIEQAAAAVRAVMAERGETPVYDLAEDEEGFTEQRRVRARAQHGRR